VKHSQNDEEKHSPEWTSFRNRIVVWSSLHELILIYGSSHGSVFESSMYQAHNEYESESGPDLHNTQLDSQGHTYTQSCTCTYIYITIYTTYTYICANTQSHTAHTHIHSKHTSIHLKHLHARYTYLHTPWEHLTAHKLTHG